mmetsp:Transcript_33909/g.62436  ORF Transcript_33909/g.62436 Transcript_33909/m.62436 type:complete len:221 (+) Transcript_33909:976-1638(+)
MPKNRGSASAAIEGGAARNTRIGTEDVPELRRVRQDKRRHRTAGWDARPSRIIRCRTVFIGEIEVGFGRFVFRSEVRIGGGTFGGMEGGCEGGYGEIRRCFAGEGVDGDESLVFFDDESRSTVAKRQSIGGEWNNDNRNNNNNINGRIHRGMLSPSNVCIHNRQITKREIAATKHHRHGSKRRRLRCIRRLRIGERWAVASIQNGQCSIGNVVGWPGYWN